MLVDRPVALRRAVSVVPALAVLVVALPLLTDRTFGYDWPNHLWLVWQQSQSIAALGRPSYFLQSSQGVFEPFFAFYGGTFYAVTGGVAALIGGNAVLAYCGAIILAFAGAYLGWWWLAHQVGQRGWAAHAPGLLFITAPYVMTDAFARGDIPETVAAAALPLVAASGLAVLRTDRVRTLPAATLVVSVAWFSGAHNITTLWGTTFLAVVALIALMSIGPGSVQRGRVIAVVALVLLGYAINCWYLFPALAYGGRTVSAHAAIGALSLDAWHVVFDPLRNERSMTGSTINVQTPVLPLGWAIVVLAGTWRGLSRSWRRVATGLGALVAALLALILTNMTIVPQPWENIQFPYRAQMYVTLGISALVLCAITGVRAPSSAIRWRTLTLGILAVIVVVSLGQAIDQEWSQPSELSSRQSALPSGGRVPSSWYAGFAYADGSLPVVRAATTVRIPVTGHADTSSLRVVSAATALATDVYGGPYLVRVTGARVVGRTATGALVLRPQAPPRRRATIGFSGAENAPVVAGIATTLAALLVSLLLLLAAAVRRRRGTANGPAMSVNEYA